MEGFMKKVIKRFFIVMMVSVLLIVGIFFAMFHNEIKTLQSIRKVDDYGLYTMEYAGDYGFDDFLETGASSDTELIQFVTSKLLKGIPLKFSIPNLGCSTFNATTTDGEAIFGRNFDLTYSPALFVRCDPENGYASLSTVNLGFLGYHETKLPDNLLSSIITLAAPYAPLDGVNEKGLAIGVLLIPKEATNQQTDRIDITTTTAVRMVLDKAATVEEAVALLSQYDMHSSANSSYHFQIADASGRSVVVEYLGNEMKVVEMQGDWQAATNFLLSEGVEDPGHGQDRYAILEKTLNDKGGVLDEDEGMDLLEAVSQDLHLNDENEISGTQWSIVYNLSEQRADIVVGMKYDSIYEYSLAE